MLYTSLISKAMQIAYKAHEGQRDQSGVPYIFHPYHLAEQMADETSVCVALLHDVVEDTDVTMEELEEVFPVEITDALQLLTHKKGMDYFDYVRAIRANPIARKVKLADIIHNSDESRIAGCTDIPEEKIIRWRKKYKKAREILEDSSL